MRIAEEQLPGQAAPLTKKAAQAGAGREDSEKGPIPPERRPGRMVA
jgi:hypothetical protein